MYRKYLFIIAIIFVSNLTNIFGQKTKTPFQRNGMVEYVVGDAATMTVVSTSSADKLNIAIAYAERNALENILFKGIPNSTQENPMIEDQDKARSTSLDQLINGGYKQFLMNSVLVDKEKVKKMHYATIEVKFDMNALRKHLEKNGMVRKFGF